MPGGHGVIPRRLYANVGPLYDVCLGPVYSGSREARTNVF